MKPVTGALKTWLTHNYNVSSGADDDEFRNKAAEAIEKGMLARAEFDRLMGNSAEAGTKVKEFIVKSINEALSGNGGRGNMRDTETKTSKLDELFGGGNGGGNIRVKDGIERYCGKKSVALHKKTGQPVFDDRGRQAETASEAEHALIGVWFKELGRRSGASVVLNDHEKDLLGYLLSEKQTWCGLLPGKNEQWVENFSGLETKSLLGDSLSGGVSLTPAIFDAQLVTFPLLNSEIFPLVDLRNIAAGQTVNSGSVGNPTVTWGVADGTAVGLFNTDSLVAAITTTVHPVAAAMTIGVSMLQDSPADVGRIILENIGQRLSAELDRVVVSGDGVNEPTGLTVSAGLAAVNSVNGAAGGPTLADYHALMFGVGKQYRNAAMRNVFISNDTTYQRSRSIKTDPATPGVNQTPIFGVNNVQSYTTLEVPHKIMNSLGNGTALFGAMSRYVMYRRAGAQTRIVTESESLARRNEQLIIVRAQYGGKCVDASAFSKSTDMQS